MRFLALILLLLPGFAAAQEGATAPGAVLRWLDRVSGATTDIELRRGDKTQVGTLDVALADCRYPVANPAENAFAYLDIRERNSGEIVFDGWMIAASPALSALDHPRYDIWVLRCMTP